MRIDHGLKLDGDKLIITLPLKDGKKPSEVVVNGKIYAPQEKAQLSEEDATFDIPSAEPKTPSNGSITSINPENTHDRTMGDLISRQDAVGGVDK